MTKEEKTRPTIVEACQRLLELEGELIPFQLHNTIKDLYEGSGRAALEYLADKENWGSGDGER